MHKSNSFWLLPLVIAGNALALPISFSRNQGVLDYHETRSPNFYLYHDARTPHEAEAVLKSLEAVRPTMEKWIGIKRSSPLPVVMSATTDGASFANFITDAIELQTLGQGGRDLAWHEYVHSSMYRHLDNIFGPAGSVIHLPWMPAWWIEGLAEALSVSVGSDWLAGIERYHVLTGYWPSYDKLHSLYGRKGFTLEGYATSGAFVSYLLTKYDAKELPKLLEDFYDYSMPWWWPWAAVPFNNFMPMDAALENLTKKSGRQLYEEYKEAATAYWKSKDLGPYMQEGRRVGASFSLSNGMQVKGEHLYQVVSENYEIKEIKLRFGGKDKKWITTWDTVRTLPDKAYAPRVAGKDYLFYLTAYTPDDLETFYQIRLRRGEKDHVVFESFGFKPKLFETKEHLYWFENLHETSRLCYIDKAKAFSGTKITEGEIACPLQETFPVSLTVIGNEGERPTNEITLRKSTETLYGTKHEVIFFDTAKQSKTSQAVALGGRPLAHTRLGDDHWFLMGNRASRFLRKVSATGQCLEERSFADHALRLFSLKGSKKLVLSFYHNHREVIGQFAPEEFKQRSCQMTGDHTSPLLYAMQQEKPGDLNEAMARTSTWHEPTEEELKQENSKNEAAPPIDAEPTAAPLVKDQPAKWRGRSLFAFPWIGADAGGTQLGFISVPLMDNMQNESVRLNMMWGLASRYPQTEVLFLTNRFKTTYTLSVFRGQAYNGAVGNDILYYDEKGGQVTATRYFPTLYLVMDGGLKSSTFVPYIGPAAFVNGGRRGHQNEFFLGLTWSKTFGRFSWSNYVSGRATPEFANKVWEYNTLGFGTSISFPVPLFSWRTTNLSFGLSTSRTRSTDNKHKVLREVYRPLKTFVPGTGGGFNEINVTLVGPGYLTGAQYGDTQARFKTSWIVPLVYDLEKLIGIFYLERLDFSAFYNYGGAWYDAEPDIDNLIGAHGYNLDLQADIKGVNVNTGLGVGQVVGKEFELYFLFGFDALIN